VEEVEVLDLDDFQVVQVLVDDDDVEEDETKEEEELEEMEMDDGFVML
jgi:hypothetical protein